MTEKLPKHIERELLAAINAVPSEYFWCGEVQSVVNEAIDKKRREWRESPEYKKQCEDYAKQAERRQITNAEKAETREIATRAAIKRGDLKKGTFLKVLGARDGSGIRMVLEIKPKQLVCRQYVPTGRQPYTNDTVVLRMSNGELKWFNPGLHCTTHGFDKVAHLLKQV